MSLRDAVLDALAVLLPVDCAGCGAPDRRLCPACRAALAPAITVIELDPHLTSSPPVVVGLSYADTARRVILAFKDGDRPGLAPSLSPALAAAAQELTRRLGRADAEGALLCPIPPSPAARRRRGYAPVIRLAQAAGLRPTSLLELRRGNSQKALDAAGRERNARDRIRLVTPVRGRRIVLLDDVVTTGATLRAAALTLRSGGAEVLGAVALAARLWRPEPPVPGPRGRPDRAHDSSPETHGTLPGDNVRPPG